MRYLFLLSFAIPLVVASGCATIVQGENQSVPVETTPSGASVIVNGIDMGQTPLVLDLKRGDDHTIEFQLDGYRTSALRLNKSLDFVPAVVGNVFSWGLIGIVVDFASGAAYELEPEELLVTMEAQGMTLAPSDDPSQIRVVLFPLDVVEAAQAGR